MTEHEASRTLVKSPPELWAELSDPSSLAGHLAESFGEIRITRLEPETAVAWEGERASGTVRIEPSGWGTRVTLTARAAPSAPASAEPAPAEPVQLPRPVPAPDPVPPAAAELAAPLAERPAVVEEAQPVPARRGFFGRLLGLFGGTRDPAPAAPDPGVVATAQEPEEPVVGPVELPEAVAAPAPVVAAAPPAQDTSEVDPAEVLVGVLDRLGAAHHRPFSRS